MPGWVSIWKLTTANHNVNYLKDKILKIVTIGTQKDTEKIQQHIMMKDLETLIRQST